MFCQNFRQNWPPIDDVALIRANPALYLSSPNAADNLKGWVGNGPWQDHPEIVFKFLISECQLPSRVDHIYMPIRGSTQMMCFPSETLLQGYVLPAYVLDAGDRSRINIFLSVIFHAFSGAQGNQFWWGALLGKFMIANWNLRERNVATEENMARRNIPRQFRGIMINEGHNVPCLHFFLVSVHACEYLRLLVESLIGWRFNA